MNASWSFLYAFAAAQLDTAGRTHSGVVSCRYAWDRFTIVLYGYYGVLAARLLESWAILSTVDRCILYHHPTLESLARCEVSTLGAVRCLLDVFLIDVLEELYLHRESCCK